MQLVKISEKLLTIQLSGPGNDILDPFQSACQRQYSCETTLIHLLEDWKQSVDGGYMVGILSTEMSKAFDSLHPSLLLGKLNEYGLSESALALM